jgi:hypothetical protein
MMQAPESQRNTAGRLESAAPAQRRVNWWLRVTSTGWDKPQETVQQREIARRSVLLSWILLGEVVALLLFIPAALTNTPTIFSLAGAAVGLVVTIFLNRKGFVTAAGALLVFFVISATMLVVIGSPDGKVHLVYLPAYDFLGVSVILGAAVLPRSSAFIIAGIDIVIIYADLMFQDKSKDLLDALQAFGLPTLAGRPVVILVLTAVVAFLWARGMDDAVKRADRAEELRAIEQRFNQAEAEHTARVEEFVQEVINAIGALANGQEGLMLLPTGHPWQQQATFINTQLRQFYRLKQGSKGSNEQIAFAAETLLRLLQRMNSGQVLVGALDPRQFTTRVPVIDEIARYLYFMLQGKQAPVIQARQAPTAPTEGSRPLRASSGPYTGAWKQESEGLE